METVKFNEMQTVKRNFFAMRNGVIADTLRKAGAPFRIIFGLNLPQLVDIARQTGASRDLAEALWANTTTRESMLLAPMLADANSFSKEDALRWIKSIPTEEVADILCHRLLRKAPWAWSLAEDLVTTPELAPYARYTGLRLAFNLVGSDPERAARLASLCTDTPLARSLAEEAEFLLGN